MIGNWYRYILECNNVLIIRQVNQIKQVKRV
jgi:hypothetical protein